MNAERRAPLTALASAVIVAFIVQMPAAAQAPEGERRAGRTAWGDPDLQGVYTFSTQTPLERPEALGNKATYTPEELAALERATAEQRASDEISAAPGELGAAYNTYWTTGEKGRLLARTSLIVDPPNGRLPPLTERAQRHLVDRAAALAARQVGEPPFVYDLFDTWLDHPTYTRCVSRPMPRIGQQYNHGLQILQSPGYVVIYYESMHDTRIIPLDGRAHLDPSVRQWNGDSRGHWEGDTLVVDWRNLTDKQEYRALGLPQGNSRFVERITKVDEDTVRYEVTVEDATIWTQPWTFVTLWRGDDPNYQQPVDLYEFGCHEGNYRMMENSLNGSRTLREQYAEPE